MCREKRNETSAGSLILPYSVDNLSSNDRMLLKCSLAEYLPAVTVGYRGLVPINYDYGAS